VINLVDRKTLPTHFPTQGHDAEFWEELGRAVATFGFLEEVLGKAIFAVTATHPYEEDQIDEALSKWLPQLKRALTDQLWNLAESYGKAVREHPNAVIENVNSLVEDIKKATQIRNVLCHGSWGTQDNKGASVPFFVNREIEIFTSPIDAVYLREVRKHVVELAVSVIDSVTSMGWQFPGASGTGKSIW
jgi:hypothetical protein